MSKGTVSDSLRRAVHALVLALVLAACLWIAWRVPYTHDDWDWGLPKGLAWWLGGEMNNRYCGSFFVVVMTRSRFVKALVMGLTIFAIPLLSAVIAARHHPKNRFALTLLGCGALMAMPMTSWQQTYGWVSAFSNFVIGGLWLLGLILLVTAVSHSGGGPGREALAAVFLAALSAQLFIENMTAVVAVGAVIFAVWAWTSGRDRGVALALLAGAGTGFMLMFANPLYADLVSTGSAVDGVRKLMIPDGAGPIGAAGAAARRFFEVILPELFECYPAVWALVCGGGVWRAVRARRPWGLTVPSAAFTGWFLCCCWLSADHIRQGVEWSYPLPMLRFWGPPVVCVLLLLVLATDPDRRGRPLGLALLAAAVALVCPFALLWEHGARCCFVSAVLLLLLGLSLLDDLPPIPLTAAASLVLAGAMLFHIQVYQVIGDCSDLRERLMREAVDRGSRSVVLPTESWEYYYFWGRNPASAMRAPSFRAFYRLPEDMELIFLRPGSYDLWPDIPQEMLDGGVVY